MTPDVGQEVEAEPAVGLGDGDAEQAELAHLLHDVGREAVLALEFRGDGRDLPGHESCGRCR